MYFRQGWGGTPESILSFAKYVTARGVAVDAVTREGIYRDLGQLTDLPTSAGEPSSVGTLDLTPYAAVYLAGAWNPLAPQLVAKARRAGLRTLYAPKGNLAYADFKRLRDLKKFAYLALVEGPLVRACSGIVLSSKVERDSLVLPRWMRPTDHVIAEPFFAASVKPHPSPSGSDGPITMGFLAEIAPRKGLKEFALGFKRWLENHGECQDVRLMIAGEPRPGSEVYAKRCRTILAELESQGVVSWIGPVRGESRTAFYQDLDLFVVPSRFESYGLTPLEALAHGRPVVCGPRIGVLEWLPERPAVLRLADLGPNAFVAAFDRAQTDLERIRASAMEASQALFPSTFRRDVTDAFLGALGVDLA